MKKSKNIITQKEIDALGRVVIPRRYREMLGIEKNTEVDLVLNKDNIEIKPRKRACVLCKGYRCINETLGICEECIRTIKELTDDTQPDL